MDTIAYQNTYPGNPGKHACVVRAWTYPDPLWYTIVSISRIGIPCTTECKSQSNRWGTFISKGEYGIMFGSVAFQFPFGYGCFPMGIHILLAMGFQIWIWIRSYIKADLERFTPELRMRDYLDFLDMRFDMRANPYPDSMQMQMDSTPRFASESLRICDHIHIGNCTWNMPLRTNGPRICGPICPGYGFHENV